MAAGTPMVGMLFWLLVAHALTDFPLQGDFLAKAKNHKAPLPGVPWHTALLMHALISAGGVAFVTGSVFLALLELATHTVIDYGKNRGSYGFNVDQVLHVWCKVSWLFLYAGGVR